MSYINELKKAMVMVDEYNKTIIPKVKKYSKLLEANGYNVFTDDSKDYNINMLAIRTGTGCTNLFDDTLVLFWKYKGLWTVKEYSCTTKPGHSYFTPNYIKKLGGVAMLVPGSYKYKLGLHRGLYEALRQAEPVKVYRLSDKKYNGLEPIKTLNSSINIHRANINGQSTRVNKWSAGCIVLNKDYDDFMDIMKKSLNIYKEVSLRLIVG